MFDTPDQVYIAGLQFLVKQVELLKRVERELSEDHVTVKSIVNIIFHTWKLPDQQEAEEHTSH